MKKLSDEFVLSVGMLLTSFLMFQAAILPVIYPKRDSLPAAVSMSFGRNVYELKQSTKNPGAYSFNYEFTSSPRLKEATVFDLPIAPFELKKAGDFGRDGRESIITDAWGYPVRENAFMVRTSSRGQEKSGGDDRSDEDPDVIGQLNCRENTDITGYFKAYFEDVALDNNVDYDDPVFGEGRREEACQVLQDIAALIKLDDTDVTPDILFMKDPGSIPPNALAAASAYFGFYDPYLDNGSLHKHIISHEDPTTAPGDFDAFIITNFNGVNWDVDSDLNPGTYDFYSVIYHEVMHTLGFRGLLPSVIGSTGGQHMHDTFDYYSYRDESLDSPFFNQTNSNLQVSTGAPSPWFITNNVVYRGLKNIVDALPDGVRPVYSPSIWQQGSSLSHFDMERADGEVYVMHPSIPTNTVRLIHEHEKEVLCHLGYEVTGLDDCEGPTPLAVDDSEVIPDTWEQVCVQPLQNDEGFDGGQLRMNSLTPIQIETGDTIVYYSWTNCSGLILPSADNARSFTFSPEQIVEPRTLSYRVENATTGRISNEAQINLVSLATCNDDEDEYICNGNFEMSFGEDNINVECPTWDPLYSDTLFWCNYLENHGIVLSEVFNPFLFSEINGDYIGDVNQNFPATFVTKLKQPLEAGEEYILSFDLAWVDSTLFPSLVFGFNEEPTVGNPAPWLSGPASTPAQQIASTEPGVLIASTPGVFSWYHHEIPFIATGNYEAFVFGDTVQKDFLDNFSLKKASDIINPEVGDSAIKGIVYYDANSNGALDAGETGLSGIEVGLFQSGSSTPIQTTLTEDFPDLGEYSFENLPNGFYQMALINESVYSQITQPTANTIIPGYSYARQTNLPGGMSSVLNHFGVVLDTADTVNIHLKKGLIDSSISVFDRNITWQIEASNLGLDTAHNVFILDLPPTPLIYYNHLTQYPNTYNPGTGIWHIPELAPGQMAVLQLTMKVPLGTCGTKINVATLQSVYEIDTDSSDNSSSSQIKLRNCSHEIESVK